jgi:soluble lytic murein transglycosylase-like protein
MRPLLRALLLALSLPLTVAARPAAALSDAARGALRAGDCGPARAEAGGARTDPERLALARCLTEAGEAAAALAQITAVKDPLWSDWARLLAAEALLLGGQPGGAAAKLDSLQLPGTAAERATFLRGRALIEAGQLDAGRAVLSPMLSGPFGARGRTTRPGGADPAEVRWWLAQGALRRGDKAAAIGALERVWVMHPNHARGAEAEAHLKQLGADPTRLQTEADRARVGERIKTLEALDLHAEALALRDALGPMGPRAEAKAAFAGRDYARAAAAYGKLSDKSSQERFDEALATSRAGDYPGAARLYTALYTAEPGTKLADTASFKVGYLRYDGGQLDEALPALRAHLQRYPASAHGDEARWFIGWSLVRLDRRAEAREALNALLVAHPKSELAPAARYWSARLSQLDGDEATAKAGYEAILRGWPSSGYAWFAAERLGKTYAGLRPAPPPAAPPALAHDPRWVRGLGLAELGFESWARAELAPVEPVARAAGPEARLALAHALVLAGDFGAAKAILPTPCGSPGPKADPRTAAVCWPRPLGDEALRRAKAGGLDPNLPFGIMMAESGMKPEVSSPAGARGLMQLMPSLGQRLEAARGQPFHPDRLYSPGYNAALGIEELSNLQRAFGGKLQRSSLPAVIAGYNGGQAAVERWLGAYPGPPEPDRFAEDVSFTETRRYVKRVLGYLQTWRLVWGDAPAPAGG